jgi:hypothetical protein
LAFKRRQPFRTQERGCVGGGGSGFVIDDTQQRSSSSRSTVVPVSKGVSLVVAAVVVCTPHDRGSRG